MTTDRTPTGDLREHLRAAIDDAGRHQVTIAADLGVTTKHLRAMLTGRARLTLEWAERIAEACGRQVVVAVVDPDSGLRERLREALTREHYRRAAERIEASVEEHCAGFADAVLPVVEAAITRARAACCEDGDRTYAEMERHLTRRAEEAEKQRDAAHRMLERIPDVHMRFGVVGVVEPEDAACADWCYACRLERAETAVQRVRDLADAADADVSGSFARRFGGEPFPAKVPTEVLRAALDAKQPTGQPALTEVVTEEATRLAATATSGVDATEVTVNLDAEQTEAAPRPDDTCQAMPDLYPTLGKESL